MRLICCLIGLGLGMLCAPAAHLQLDVQNFTTSALTNRTLRLTPRSIPSLSGSGIVARDALTYRTDASGQIIVSNVIAGTYTVEILGTNSTAPFTSFMISVPSTNALVNANNLIAVSTSASADFTAYSQSQANGRFLLRDGGYGTYTTLSNVVLLGTITGIMTDTSAISGDVFAGVVTASNLTASRVLSTDAQGYVTNLPAGTAGQIVTSTGDGYAWSNAPASTVSGLTNQTLLTNWGVSGTASNYVFDFSAAGTNQHPTYYVPCTTNAQMVFYVTNAPANTVGRINVILDNSMTTTNRTLAFPAAWNGLGSTWATTLTLTNGKTAKLSLESFGTSNGQSNILAGYAPRY